MAKVIPDIESTFRFPSLQFPTLQSPPFNLTIIDISHNTAIKAIPTILPPLILHFPPP